MDHVHPNFGHLGKSFILVWISKKRFYPLGAFLKCFNKNIWFLVVYTDIEVLVCEKGMRKKHINTPAIVRVELSVL